MKRKINYNTNEYEIVEKKLRNKRRKYRSFLLAESSDKGKIDGNEMWYHYGRIGKLIGNDKFMISMQCTPITIYNFEFTVTIPVFHACNLNKLQKPLSFMSNIAPQGILKTMFAVLGATEPAIQSTDQAIGSNCYMFKLFICKFICPNENNKVLIDGLICALYCWFGCT